MYILLYISLVRLSVCLSVCLSVRPLPWGLFRGRVKISTFFRRSASWFRRRIRTKGEKTAKLIPTSDHYSFFLRFLGNMF